MGPYFGSQTLAGSVGPQEAVPVRLAALPRLRRGRALHDYLELQSIHIMVAVIPDEV